MPYVAYLLLTIYYMVHVVCVDKDEIPRWVKFLGFINVLIICQQINVEYVQIKQETTKRGIGSYLLNVMNIMDICQFTVNIFLILLTLFGIEWPSLPARRIVASISVLFIWLKIFDWLRLFDTTTFYIKLIIVTLKDILPFFLILPFFMLMFGTSLHILNLSRTDDNDMVDDFMGYWVLDILVNEYLLALGEFTMDNFAG